MRFSQPVLGAVGGAAAPRPDLSRVTEVGDHPHDCAAPGVQLGRDVGPHVLGQHRDSIGTAVQEPLQATGPSYQTLAADGAGVDGRVGEDVLDVEHERHAPAARRSPAGQAEGDRRRHRQHRIGPIPRDGGGRGGEHREGREAGGAGQDTAARRRERMDPRHRDARDAAATHQPAPPLRLHTMLPVPGQRRDHSDVVTPALQLGDDGGHHDAGGRQIGLVVRADNQQTHQCAGSVVSGATDLHASSSRPATSSGAKSAARSLPRSA